MTSSVASSAGASYTVPTALAVVVFALVFGSLVGTIAGYLGGVTSNVIMRITDLFLSYPSLLLAIAVTAALGQGLIQAQSRSPWSRGRRTPGWRTSRRWRCAPPLHGCRRDSGDPDLATGDVPYSSQRRAPMLIKATMELGLCVEWIAALGFVGWAPCLPHPNGAP